MLQQQPKLNGIVGQIVDAYWSQELEGGHQPEPALLDQHHRMHKAAAVCEEVSPSSSHPCSSCHAPPKCQIWPCLLGYAPATTRAYPVAQTCCSNTMFLACASPAA